MGRRALLVLWLLILASHVDAGQPGPRGLSPADYISRLDGLLSYVGQLDERHPDQFPRVFDELPTSWRVVTPECTFDVSADWLRSALNEYRRHPTAAARTRLTDRLRMMRSEAASLQDVPSEDISPARARLAGILATREFQSIHGPTAWDRFWRWVLQGFLSLLERMFGTSSMATITRLMVYVLLALAVGLAAIWIHRSLRGGAGLDLHGLDHLSDRPKPWDAWLADARRSAANEDWREAIRFAYWCAVTFLEEQRAWRPDPSRTPREYLRLLPASSQHLPPLASLSRLLERVWYGAARADAAEFDEALAHLKNLGCPSL